MLTGNSEHGDWPSSEGAGGAGRASGEGVVGTGRASSFHIVNLGCKVNRVEADTMSAALRAGGSKAVAEEAADLVLVNTCTVTGEADKKTRKAVRHALAVNPVADIVVTGCSAAINPDVFLEMDPRVKVMGKRAIEEALGVGSHGGTQEGLLRFGEGFRTRVGVKVQDGCDHACTYCIVHVARGPAYSVACSRVEREARAHFEAGVKELVLTGIDIAAYQDGDIKLAQLASRVLAQADEAFTGDGYPARIRISSVEPLNVDDAIIELLAQSCGRVCRHLHLPLQSGSSKVLSEMDRPYDAEYFAGLAAKLKRAVPGVSLSTDVIVGFPGESDGDFRETLELVREVGFSKLHVFPYSRRQGTPAAERSDQIDAEVKRNRAAVLRELGKRLGEEDRARRAGSTELVLVEGATGLTESYHEIEAPAGAVPGELAMVTL